MRILADLERAFPAPNALDQLHALGIRVDEVAAWTNYLKIDREVEKFFQ